MNLVVKNSLGADNRKPSRIEVRLATITLRRSSAEELSSVRKGRDASEN